MSIAPVSARLCLFDTSIGGPKHPQASDNRSMLFRFAGDDRLFGAVTTFGGDPIPPGRCRAVLLQFMFPEALEVAVSGSLFEVTFGPRVIGLGLID